MIIFANEIKRNLEESKSKRGEITLDEVFTFALVRERRKTNFSSKITGCDDCSVQVGRDEKLV